MFHVAVVKNINNIVKNKLRNPSNIRGNISFSFDCKCFFGTIFSVLKHDGVVEGGTGELHKQEEKVAK